MCCLFNRVPCAAPFLTYNIGETIISQAYTAAVILIHGSIVSSMTITSLGPGESDYMTSSGHAQIDAIATP
jgi:hypothetical protein